MCSPSTWSAAAKLIPLLKTQFFEYGTVFSPDGKWVAFLSDESGNAEIYLQAIDRGDDSLRVTGERFLVSRQGAQCLRWRKDARELYYLGLDGQVYAVPLAFRPLAVDAGKPEALFTIDAEARATLHSACLIRRCRRWKPLRDSFDDPGRELGNSGAARLGVAGCEVKFLERLLRPRSTPDNLFARHPPCHCG